MGDYSRECNRLNVPQVVFMDKKDVTDFFTGVTNESRMIEASRRAETLIRKSDLKAGRSVHVQDGPVRKRTEKAEEKKTQFDDWSKQQVEPQTVPDMLFANERKIHTRSTVL